MFSLRNLVELSFLRISNLSTLRNKLQFANVENTLQLDYGQSISSTRHIGILIHIVCLL